MTDIMLALQQITNELDRANASILDALRNLAIAIQATRDPLVGMKIGVPRVLCEAEKWRELFRPYPATYEILAVDMPEACVVVISDVGRFEWLSVTDTYPRFTSQGVELDTPTITVERNAATYEKRRREYELETAKEADNETT